MLFMVSYKAAPYQLSRLPPGGLLKIIHTILITAGSKVLMKEIYFNRSPLNMMMSVVKKQTFAVAPASW